MGKGGIVFYFWGADATEKGSLGPNTVVNSNQKKSKTQELHVGAYVDDLTIISSDPKALAWLDAKLSARFPMQAAEARDLNAERGEKGVGWILSMEVLYYPRLGICELKQEHSIEKLAAKYGVTESKPVSLPGVSACLHTWDGG